MSQSTNLNSEVGATCHPECAAFWRARDLCSCPVHSSGSCRAGSCPGLGQGEPCPYDDTPRVADAAGGAWAAAACAIRWRGWAILSQSSGQPRVRRYEKIALWQGLGGAIRQLADGCARVATRAAPTRRFFHTCSLRGFKGINTPVKAESSFRGQWPTNSFQFSYITA
jgi:hypothetical protein